MESQEKSLFIKNKRRNSNKVGHSKVLTPGKESLLRNYFFTCRCMFFSLIVKQIKALLGL